MQYIYKYQSISGATFPVEIFADFSDFRFGSGAKIGNIKKIKVRAKTYTGKMWTFYCHQIWVIEYHHKQKLLFKEQY